MIDCPEPSLDGPCVVAFVGQRVPTRTYGGVGGAEPRGSGVVLPPLWHWDGSEEELAAWRSAMEGTGGFQLCRTTEIPLGDDLYEGWWRSQPTTLTELAIQSVLPCRHRL
jgi:hypothetical protein